MTQLGGEPDSYEAGAQKCHALRLLRRANEGIGIIEGAQGHRI